MTLTFDLLTLKVVSESHVTCATSVPILVFLCLSVLDLVPMYTTDRQTDRRQTRAYFNVPTGTDVLGDWKSVLEDWVTRA